MGVGHTVIDAAEFPFARKEVVHILKHAYRSRHVPLIANCSQRFFLGKGNGAAGMAGIRLIHLFCSFWLIDQKQESGSQRLASTHTHRTALRVHVQRIHFARTIDVSFFALYTEMQIFFAD